MTPMIEVKTTLKIWRVLLQFENVSFNVKEGIIFAFLGPNGAGKSTRIILLVTMIGKNIW